MAFVRKLRWLTAATMALVAGTATPVAAQDFYIGELLKLPYNFCPRSTLAADGSLLAISNFDTLYALYGTTFGGDGQTTFALPDMRGRYSMHTGNGGGLSPRALGQTGGTESNTMTLAALPQHEHVALMKGTSSTGNATSPVGNAFGVTPAIKYASGTAPSQGLMERGTIVVADTGGGQPYSIIPPLLTIRYCVQTEGIFPPRS